MDRGALYKLALSYIGQGEYVPGSAQEAALRDIEQHAMAVCLAYTVWDWAKRTTTIRLADGVAKLPHDLLELVSCSLPSWEIIGDQLLATDKTAKEATLIYTSTSSADSLSLPHRQPLFYEAYALTLAAKAAPRITGNISLASNLEQKAREALYRAKLAQVRATHSNDQQERRALHG